MSSCERHLQETREIIGAIDPDPSRAHGSILAELREATGRLFFLGLGGSAGNCGHAVNDFRKIVAIEAYVPTDNVSGLTARTNDEGWETVFVEWLKDLVFTVSHTAVEAVERAGATTVMVDVEPGTYTMAPHELSRALKAAKSGRPAAVLPVHIYGQPAELSALAEIARGHGLRHQRLGIRGHRLLVDSICRGGP
jgi:hypothetical protein